MFGSRRRTETNERKGFFPGSEPSGKGKTRNGRSKKNFATSARLKLDGKQSFGKVTKSELCGDATQTIHVQFERQPGLQCETPGCRSSFQEQLKLRVAV